MGRGSDSTTTSLLAVSPRHNTDINLSDNQMQACLVIAEINRLGVTGKSDDRAVQIVYTRSGKAFGNKKFHLLPIEKRQMALAAAASKSFMKHPLISETDFDTTTFAWLRDDIVKQLEQRTQRVQTRVTAVESTPHGAKIAQALRTLTDSQFSDIRHLNNTSSGREQIRDRLLRYNRYLTQIEGIASLLQDPDQVKFIERTAPLIDRHRDLATIRGQRPDTPVLVIPKKYGWSSVLSGHGSWLSSYNPFLGIACVSENAIVSFQSQVTSPVVVHELIHSEQKFPKIFTELHDEDAPDSAIDSTERFLVEGVTEGLTDLAVNQGQISLQGVSGYRNEASFLFAAIERLDNSPLDKLQDMQSVTYGKRVAWLASQLNLASEEDLCQRIEWFKSTVSQAEANNTQLDTSDLSNIAAIALN